jgi:flagellar biosynthesis protein FliP
MRKMSNKVIHSKRIQTILLVVLLMAGTILLSSCTTGQDEIKAPGLTFSLEQDGQPAEVSSGVQLLVLVTVLSLAPSIIILMTSFTRIVIVLSLLRNAIGTPTVPPSQVVIGLSLLLTFFIMSPVINEINTNAIQPYANEQIDQATALDRAAKPIRSFMFEQTREKDIELFLSFNGSEQPQTLDDIPTLVLLPAFVISELKTAFLMGFLIYIPFLVIDMVISSILLAMGMMMMPPSLISLPFKLLLFVMVDGWYLITRSLLLSF